MSESDKSLKEDGKEKKDSSQSDVAFLYRTMIERDPSKRKVKPVEKHLMQIHFGMSDDDEDSDYEFKPEAASDDGGGSEMDDFDDDVDENEEDASQKSSKEETSDDDAETVEEDEEEEGEDNSNNDTKKMSKVAEIAASRSFTSMRVCCVCLTGSTGGDDEIIECDSCGILVHEGCYGTIEDDAMSVHSDMSTESTVPWFCDPCKAGITPTCELCPNQFGIYKQTDTGRWVHLICALYVPAVAFGNTEKLTNVTLLEMPYSKFGSKECSLCEDENYSYAGVCIGCDAGMCKAYFHVTCAQKQGFLSEASIDEDIADPFYAHCKMHSDKYISKQKKRNFLTLQSHVTAFRAEKRSKPVSSRIRRRLEHFKKKFLEAEAKRPPAWIPPTKLPRAISSSASAVRSLMRKAELLDMTLSPKASVPRNDVVKKSHVAPALSVEFASFFHQRNQKIENLQKTTQQSLKEIESLKSQEKSLQEYINKMKFVQKELADSYEDNRKTGLALYQALNAISSKIAIPPKLMKESQKLGSSSQKSDTSQAHTNYQCGICSQTEDQHLLAKCDQCYKHYHLKCLDPPLLRMPKKSKLCGWVCSICDHKNKIQPSETVGVIDTDAPRMLRQSIKEPDKFIPTELQLFVEKRRAMAASNRVKKRNRPEKKVAPTKKSTKKAKVKLAKIELEDVGDKLSEASEQSKDANTEHLRLDDSTRDSLASPTGSATASTPKGRKPKNLETGICIACHMDCNGGNAVRCDGCSNWYHFSCLKPPAKKSPKHRGYQWFCDSCESADDETADKNENMDVDKAEEKTTTDSGEPIETKDITDDKEAVASSAKAEDDKAEELEEKGNQEDQRGDDSTEKEKPETADANEDSKDDPKNVVKSEVI